MSLVSSSLWSAVVVASALVPQLAHSQTVAPPISTDRPGLGFSLAVVPAGSLQLELGTPAVATDAAGNVDSRLLNLPLMIRFGISPRLELRAGGTTWNIARTKVGGVTQTVRGFGAIEVGAKYAVTDGSRGIPFAIMPSVILPVGDDEFSSSKAAYTLQGAAGFTLPAGWGLTTVLGTAATADDEGDYQLTGSLIGVLGRTISGPLAGYLESGWYPTGQGEDPAYVGAGVTWRLRNALQLDASLNRSLTDAASDWLFGAGISVRF